MRNLRQPDAVQSIRFNFVVRVKFELAQPIRCRLRVFLLLIRYVTAVTLNFDLCLTLKMCSRRLCHGRTLYEI